MCAQCGAAIRSARPWRAWGSTGSRDQYRCDRYSGRGRRWNTSHRHQGRVSRDRRANCASRWQRDLHRAGRQPDFEDRQGRQRLYVSRKHKQLQRAGVRFEGASDLDSDRSRAGANRSDLSKGQRSDAGRELRTAERSRREQGGRHLFHGAGCSSSRVLHSSGRRGDQSGRGHRRIPTAFS